MYDNKIYYISEKQANELISSLQKNPQNHIGIIDGQIAQTWTDYLSQIRKQYEFPTTEDGFDAYEDWMEDLSWLNKDSYSLFIFDYEKFMIKEPDKKSVVMSIFLEGVLTWWSVDADKFWGEGKTRPFNIYLVN